MDFHTAFGAEVVRSVADFRPEDVDNEGVGVLIQYNVKALGRQAETQAPWSYHSIFMRDELVIIYIYNEIVL